LAPLVDVELSVLAPHAARATVPATAHSRTTGLTRCLMVSLLLLPLFASRTSVRNPSQHATPGAGGRQYLRSPNVRARFLVPRLVAHAALLTRNVPTMCATAEETTPREQAEPVFSLTLAQDQKDIRDW